MCNRCLGKGHRHSGQRFASNRTERRSKKSTTEDVSNIINRGEQVLSLDLLFSGDNSIEDRRVPDYTQLLAATGDRPVGLEAAQLLGITKWMEAQMGARTKHILSTGIRSQAVSIIAAALEPATYAEISILEGMRTFGWLLDRPVAYESAPDLFCLDLYRKFDVPLLVALAAPTRFHHSYSQQRKQKPSADSEN